jgi:hypothetical protein
MFKYILTAYAPMKVILNRSESDGRSWVATTTCPDGEFWVSTAQLYDTVEACIKGNEKTLRDHVKTLLWEIREKSNQVEATLRLLDKA